MKKVSLAILFALAFSGNLLASEEQCTIRSYYKDNFRKPKVEFDQKKLKVECLDEFMAILDDIQECEQEKELMIDYVEMEIHSGGRIFKSKQKGC